MDDHGSGSEANEAGSESFTSWDCIGRSIWKVLWESSGQVWAWPCPLFLVEKTGCPCRDHYHLGVGVIVKSFNSWILPCLTLKYFNKSGLSWRNLLKKPPQMVQASGPGLRTTGLAHSMPLFFFLQMRTLRSREEVMYVPQDAKKSSWFRIWTQIFLLLIDIKSPPKPTVTFCCEPGRWDRQWVLSYPWSKVWCSQRPLACVHACVHSVDITEYFLFAMYCGRLWGLGSGPDTQVLLHGAHTLVRDTVNRLTSDSDIKKKKMERGSEFSLDRVSGDEWHFIPDGRNMRGPGLQRSGAWKSTKNLTWVRIWLVQEVGGKILGWR